MTTDVSFLQKTKDKIVEGEEDTELKSHGVC